MVLTSAIFHFLRKGHFMLSPVPFLELQVRNTAKTREGWTEVIKISDFTRLLLSEDDFQSGRETAPCPLPEQPGLRGQWLNWAEKNPQLWLSLDQQSFLECLCTKKSRKQVVLTPSNTGAGRLCRHSSWTSVEKKCHLVVSKGALAEIP